MRYGPFFFGYLTNFVSLFQGTMHAGSLDGPETIEACAKAALVHNANAALAVTLSTWIPGRMLSPCCWIQSIDCGRAWLVVDWRHGAREARNLADLPGGTRS